MFYPLAILLGGNVSHPPTVPQCPWQEAQRGLAPQRPESCTSGRSRSPEGRAGAARGEELHRPVSKARGPGTTAQACLLPVALCGQVPLHPWLGATMQNRVLPLGVVVPDDAPICGPSFIVGSGVRLHLAPEAGAHSRSRGSSSAQGIPVSQGGDLRLKEIFLK